ncbi:MAG: DUF1573 domain-containing protein [Saprospiraceae bacterium]|nr:DUF1573 domain-containing protein [Saprospiraceae bacterium]
MRLKVKNFLITGIVKILLCFCLVNCTISKTKDSSNKSTVQEKTNSTTNNIYSGPAKFKFDSTTYQKGQIKKGEILQFEIPFINQGADPLEIKLISACECTKVDWPVLPIPSGQKRSLKISYDSKDKSGKQIVDLDIMANTIPVNTFIKFELLVIE